jgi:hypothetical protein
MLLDAAVTVAMRCQYGYKGYEDNLKAVKALKRRCPGFSQAQYLDALRKGKLLYEASERVIKGQDYSNNKENPELLFKEKKTKEEWKIIEENRIKEIKVLTKMLELRYNNICGVFLKSTRLNAVSWAYYWIKEC